jgi:hypothetical protein
MLTLAGSILLIVHIIGVHQRKKARSYPLLGLACLVLVSVQNLVDFSLEVPGVAVYLASILAVTSSISLGRLEPISPVAERMAILPGKEGLDQ